ncbi:unnamed protein product [Symbiodinium sp. CCMP2592]|nr:unnamed protein product [Symbiodinium sp. CCMP2592]
MTQLMHTVFSVQSQRSEHGPLAGLPSKALCGQDSTGDHLRRSSAQEALLSHDPLDCGEMRFRLVVAAVAVRAVTNADGCSRVLNCFTSLLCLSQSMLSLCFLTGIISSTLCLAVALGIPTHCLRPPKSERCHVQPSTCQQRRASRTPSEPPACFRQAAAPRAGPPGRVCQGAIADLQLVAAGALQRGHSCTSLGEEPVEEEEAAEYAFILDPHREQVNLSFRGPKTPACLNRFSACLSDQSTISAKVLSSLHRASFRESGFFCRRLLLADLNPNLMCSVFLTPRQIFRCAALLGAANLEGRSLEPPMTAKACDLLGTCYLSGFDRSSTDTGLRWTA